MQIILWVTFFFFFFFAKQRRITRTGGFFPSFISSIHTEFSAAGRKLFLSHELVRSLTLFPILMIVSLVFSVISITVSLSLSLPLSQLISCWMNTAMFVSPTSDSPATSQRRNPTPACKSLLNSLLTLSAGGGVISVLLKLVSGINPFCSTNVWQFPSVYTLCVCVCIYYLNPFPSDYYITFYIHISAFQM